MYYYDGNCHCGQQSRSCPDSLPPCSRRPTGTTGPTGPTGATGPTGPTGPTGVQKILSSYIEAQGTAQTVGSEMNFIFDSASEYIDIVGTAITLNAGGSVFTITEPGLYHIEWSINLSQATAPGVLIGILENGVPSSVLSHPVTGGNVSSGALIEVTTIPFTLSLCNLGPALSIANSTGIGNTAASIRILKFADGASV